MVQIKGYKVNKLEIENRAQNGIQLKLQNQVKYNVNYLENNTCVGLLEFRILDADMQPFELKMEIVAQFSFDDGDDKADVHTESFDALFPFVRQIVNTVTGFSGISGLFIPVVKLNKDNVKTVGPNRDEPESSSLN